ncbi:MAG: hypothetical protein H6713_04655 [Myxococcales bacterium]|nr:hypothetical protein [Myxococcales bacterium]MCB9749282.1 hypothetical protein [Myxococcales bacterium]
MATLAELLTQSETRPRVVTACVSLVESEVAGKRGLSGAAVRTGFRVVKAVKPTMVAEVVDRLLPEFAEALEPFYVEAQRRAEGEDVSVGDAFADALSRDTRRAAEALLVVTDRRAEKVSGAIKKAYQRLRGTAQGHVEAAAPNLGRTLGDFLD